MVNLHPLHCEGLHLLGGKPDLWKLPTLCITVFIRSGLWAPEMITHTSGNFSLVITRQLTWSPKEESFLIIRVFHLPLLSQRFITWTIESYGQFTLSIALSFQTSWPHHINVPRTTCYMVTVALPCAGFITVQWKRKARQFTEEFLHLLNISCVFCDLYVENPLTSIQWLLPHDWHRSYGMMEASLLLEGRLTSDCLFSVWVHFFRFL